MFCFLNSNENRWVKFSKEYVVKNKVTNVPTPWRGAVYFMLWDKLFWRFNQLLQGRAPPPGL